MNGANQVRAGIGQLKAEVATGVAAGMGDLLHTLVQTDQQHAVSGSRFASRAVVEPAREGLSGKQRVGEEKYAVNKETRPTGNDSRGADLHTNFLIGVQALSLT